MNFYDEHWLAALNIARSLSPEHIHILVPDEFVNDRDVFYPAKQASQLLCRDITAFVIPKDYVEYLPIRLIQDDQFKQFCCIWADEVFVAFSSLAESLECSEAEVQRHIPAFLKRKEQILYNDKREDVLCEKLPYLLDTQENRLLKQMFPHKCYCMEQFKGLSLFPTVIKREVVKYCVKEVRIELSSYCNRSCAYCPVSILDRKNMEKKISKAIFEKCVAELQEIDFAGQLWFCMFNEPLYDQDLLMYALQYVNQHLPQCCVKIVTNGDYFATMLCQNSHQRRLFND